MDLGRTPGHDRVLDAMPVTRIVVPFAGANGKSRLQTSPAARHELALAMLGDVLEACVEVGPTLVVTGDADAAVKDEIFAACRRDLSPFKTPTSIRVVPALSMTAGGKLERVVA